MSAEVIASWQKHPLFSAFLPSQLQEIAAHITYRYLKTGEYLFRQNDVSHEIYFIEEGDLTILKTDEVTHAETVILEMGYGNTIGEIGALLKQPRSASARAVTATKVAVLDYQKIELIIARIKVTTPDIYSSIVEKLVAQQSSRLINTLEITVTAMRKQNEELKMRIHMGLFFISTLSLIICYMFSLTITNALIVQHMEKEIFFTLPFNCVLLVVVLFTMWKTGYDRKFFGLTFTNALPSLRDGFFIALLFCLLALLGKWALINYVAGFQDYPLYANLAHVNPLVLFLYVIACILQEFMVRCGIQAPLSDFLVGKRKDLWAILLAALIFGTFHLHVIWWFALATILPGLAWGWMFHRHHNIIGVAFSHFLVGVFILEVLGVKWFFSISS